MPVAWLVLFLSNVVVGDGQEAWQMLLRTVPSRGTSRLGQYWQKSFVDVFNTNCSISRKAISGEFLLHIPCSIFLSVGSISYTSHAVFCLKSTEFLWHNPFWLHFYLRSFSYISSAGLIFMWGVSLTHPMLTLFSLSRAAFIFIGAVSLTHPMLTLFSLSRAAFIFIGAVSLTHPMLTLFSLSRAGFVFYRGSFSYTPHANFVFSIPC